MRGSILQGCRAVDLFEFTLEVSGVIVPDVHCDRFDGCKRRLENLACLFHPGFLEILNQRKSHFALEQMAETRARQADDIGYLGDINVR